MSNIDISTTVSNVSSATQPRAQNPDIIEDVSLLNKNSSHKLMQVAEDEGKVKESELLKDVKENLDKLNQYIPISSTNLSFEFDEKGTPPFIRVIDKGNNEVIREIPSEEFREVAKALDEFADKLSSKGFIFDKTV
jgi:flagellar protein FlaG